MDVFAALRARTSANRFDTSRSLSEDEIRELISYATEAPSSFNIQHWRFVAIVRPADKARLRAAAFNQREVDEAAVVFIILGDVRAHERLGVTLDRSVAAGILDAAARDRWVANADRAYGENAALARDEAIRSASLAAMILMIAAQAKGLASGPIIGFDSAAVAREFAIAERYLPVMLLTVGYPAPGNWPRQPRLSVDEVLAFHRAREF